MNKYKWKIKAHPEGLPLIERIAFARFGDGVDMDDFLFPKFVLADPFLLPDMDLAVKRILRAVENNEKIVVFGDYDADGVSSSALLWELFRYIDKEIDVYIPDRFSEGYGLKESSLENIFAGGAKLIITVDCGIRDVELIKKMTAKGCDIIVTDHHNVGEKIPDCVAVVNPKRSTNKYPEVNLAGVGVAYALARAILDKIGMSREKIELFEKWHLDIVAIGTVADMMPLVGENRVIVKYGLLTLQKTKKIGLLKMMEIAGIEKNKIDSRSIGFALGPRLNAAGRVDKAMMAFDLLTEREELEINLLVKNLDDYNRERKNLTDQIVEDIFSRVDVDNLPLIIAEAGEKWSRGVVGLVASRVVEKFYRPAFVAEINEDKIVGSVRGIEGINVVKILDQLSDLLDHYGGHSMAGGFSLNKDKWDVFRSRLAEIAKDTVQTENLDRELQIDTIALPIELELSLWDKWALLEPYGLGNEEPVLVSNGLNLKSKRIIGKTGDHLKLTFEDNGKYIDALWWKNADKTSELTVGKRYDLAYKINLNEYRDKRSIDMIVVDMKNSV